LFLLDALLIVLL